MRTQSVISRAKQIAHTGGYSYRGIVILPQGIVYFDHKFLTPVWDDDIDNDTVKLHFHFVSDDTQYFETYDFISEPMSLEKVKEEAQLFIKAIKQKN